MIRAIRIEGLRGIKTGSVEELTPLSVLVGPNNAGKSTVLDALLIGGEPRTHEAIVAVVRRRRGVERGGRWLFRRGGAQAWVEVESTSEQPRRCSLQNTPDRGVVFTIRSRNDVRHGAAYFRDDNVPHGQDLTSYLPLDDVPSVHLVEPHRGQEQEPLHRVYTRVLEAGRVDQVNALLAAVLPDGFRRVEILAPEDRPLVYLTYKDGALQSSLAGDGIQTLLRLSLELAAAEGGVVLLEEPESTEHPRALHESARAIVEAVRRGVQVVISTHSLDLVDMLRAHLGDEGLPQLSVHNLACTEGKLTVVRYGGREVALARDSIGEDLR